MADCSTFELLQSLPSDLMINLFLYSSIYPVASISLENPNRDLFYSFKSSKRVKICASLTRIQSKMLNCDEMDTNEFQRQHPVREDGRGWGEGIQG